MLIWDEFEVRFKRGRGLTITEFLLRETETPRCSGLLKVTRQSCQWHSWKLSLSFPQHLIFLKGEMFRIPSSSLPFIFNIYTRKWAGTDEKYEIFFPLSENILGKKRLEQGVEMIEKDDF